MNINIMHKINDNRHAHATVPIDHMSISHLFSVAILLWVKLGWAWASSHLSEQWAPCVLLAALSTDFFATLGDMYCSLSPRVFCIANNQHEQFALLLSFWKNSHSGTKQELLSMHGRPSVDKAEKELFPACCYTWIIMYNIIVGMYTTAPKTIGTNACCILFHCNMRCLYMIVLSVPQLL